MLITQPCDARHVDLVDGGDVRGRAAPDSIKLRMSFLVTRPLRPVPSSFEISTLCSWAILRTSGLDLVRRRSSAVAALPSLFSAGGGGGIGAGFACTGSGEIGRAH